MNRVSKIFCLSVAAFLILSLPLAYSADTTVSKGANPVGTVLGKDGKPLTAEQLKQQELAQIQEKTAQTQIPPVQLTPNPPVNGTIIGATTTIAQRLCSEFQNTGDIILPNRYGGGYRCSPGYECHGVIGGFQCRWRGLNNITADSPDCRFDVCRTTNSGI